MSNTWKSRSRLIGVRQRRRLRQIVKLRKTLKLVKEISQERRVQKPSTPTEGKYARGSGWGGSTAQGKRFRGSDRGGFSATTQGKHPGEMIVARSITAICPTLLTRRSMKWDVSFLCTEAFSSTICRFAYDISSLMNSTQDSTVHQNATIFRQAQKSLLPTILRSIRCKAANIVSSTNQNKFGRLGSKSTSRPRHSTAYLDLPDEI